MWFCLIKYVNMSQEEDALQREVKRWKRLSRPAADIDNYHSKANVPEDVVFHQNNEVLLIDDDDDRHHGNDDTHNMNDSKEKDMKVDVDVDETSDELTDGHCVICLNYISDIAYLDGCDHHSFCFVCIYRWCTDVRTLFAIYLYPTSSFDQSIYLTCNIVRYMYGL